MFGEWEKKTDALRERVLTVRTKTQVGLEDKERW
jgi:hypothetical protein